MTKAEPKTKMNTQTVSKEIHKGGQSVTFTEVLQTSPKAGVGWQRKLKVSIKSDSYAEQCHARVSVWDGTQWQLAHRIRNLQTEGRLTYRPKPVTDDDFKADRTELLRVAFELLYR